MLMMLMTKAFHLYALNYNDDENGDDYDDDDINDDVNDDDDYDNDDDDDNSSEHKGSKRVKGIPSLRSELHQCTQLPGDP